MYIIMAYEYSHNWLGLEKFINIMYAFPSEQISWGIFALSF